MSFARKIPQLTQALRIQQLQRALRIQQLQRALRIQQMQRAQRQLLLQPRPQFLIQPVCLRQLLKQHKPPRPVFTATAGPWIPKWKGILVSTYDPTEIDFQTAESECNAWSSTGHLAYIYDAATWSDFQSYRRKCGLSSYQVWLGCSETSNNVNWITGTQVSYMPNAFHGGGGGGGSSQLCYTDDDKHQSQWSLDGNTNANRAYICMMDAIPNIISTELELVSSLDNAAVNQQIKFSLLTFWGQHPTTTYVWNFGDGTNQTTTNGNVTKAFSQSGWYNVTVTIANDVAGPYTVWYQVAVYQPCTIQSINYPIFATTFVSNITIQLSNGTNCSLSISLGDGTPLIDLGTVIGDVTACTTSNVPCGSVGTWVTVVPHNYTQPNTYNVYVYATNVITNSTKKRQVIVQTLLSGLQIVSPNYYVYLPYGDNLLILLQAFSGSDWSFIVWIGNTNLTTTWNSVLLNGSVLIKPTDLSCIGPQIIYFKALNSISQEILNYTFQVEYHFTNFSYMPVPTYLQTLNTYTLSFSWISASHFNYTIDLGNGVSTSASQWNMIILNKNSTLTYPSFTYTAPGIYLVTITAMNHIETKVYTFNATVQNPVCCLTYSTSSPGDLASFVGSWAPVQFTLTFALPNPYPTNAYYDYNFGEPGGSLSKVPFDQVPSQSKNYSYNHFGFYSTTVFIYNLISSMNFTLTVTVECLFKNVNFNMYRFIPQLTTEPHGYYIKTNELVNFKMTSISGSNYNLTWKFGDGNVASEFSVQSTMLTINHSYAMAGFYNATVFMENVVNKQLTLLPIPFAPYTIVVQDVITCFTYNLKEGTQILIPYTNIAGGSWSNLELYSNPTCGMKVGTLPRFIIDWGDGTPLQNGSISYDATKSKYYINLPHNYILSDTYNLNVTIWNEVSHVYFFDVITVYQEVHTTGIMVTFIDTVKQKEFHGYQANATQGYFPLENVVVFRAQKSFGTYLLYNWTFSDGWSPGHQNDTVYRLFINHGVVKVNVTIINALATDNFMYTITMERSIANVSLWDNSPWPRDYTSYHEYRLSTGVIPTDACYFLNFNDTDPQADCPYRFYGTLTTCKEFFPTYFAPTPGAGCVVESYNTSYLESMLTQGLDPNITWNHKFKTLGHKPVVTQVINHVSYYQFVYDTYVTYGPCTFPIVEVRKKNTCTMSQKCRCFQLADGKFDCSGADLPWGDRVNYIKDTLLIDADTSVNCTSSPNVWFNWTLEEIDFSGNVLADVTNEYLDGLRYQGFNTKILTLPSKQIPPGRYHFTLMVSPSMEIDMEKYDDTFIYIKTSPLIASFGTVDALFVEQGSDVVFDAWTNSYDPDATRDPKSNLSFSFFCRRACESWPEANRMQIYTDWNKYNSSACDPLDGGTYTQKGCFNYLTNENTIRKTYPGPRPLDYAGSPDGQWKQITSSDNLPGGNISLNTKMMPANQWYSLMVVLAKVGGDNDTRVAVQELMFYVSSAKVPQVLFNCITNCRTDTYTLPGSYNSIRQYRRVNPTSRFSIEALVDGFVQTESYVFEWDLVQRPPGISNLQFDIGSLPLVNESEWLFKASTNRTLRTMSIDENLWNATANEEGFYLRLSFWFGKVLTEEPMGVYYYEFFLNTPPNPFQGNCWPNHVNGTALDKNYGIMCNGFKDSQSNDLYYYVKQRLSPTSLFWIDSGNSKTSEMFDKTVYISPIAGPAETNYVSEFKIRIIDSSGSYTEIQILGRVLPFDYFNFYFYNPVYSIFNYTESCPGCDLEDFFLTKTKEQKTAAISAIARTFSSMLNLNPSSGCVVPFCDNTTMNCTFDDMNGTIITTTATPEVIPYDMQVLIEKHLGSDWGLLNPCSLDLKLKINLRERMTTTFSSLQIPYFSSFVQVVSALYPVTLIPQENTIQIMQGVEECLAKGVKVMDGVDPQMNMALEADLREEALTSVISIVSNMERTTNYYGALWRDQLRRYYPNFNMEGLLGEIKSVESGDFSNDSTTTPNSIWVTASNSYIDAETEKEIAETRHNITLIHIVLDQIYQLKDIITKFVQDRKVMGERPSVLLTENITAIYHKTPTKNMTGFPVVAECGCQFTSGDAKEMFGNLDNAEESVMAAAECGKNNPFTTDISAKSLTGYTVSMSFKNSTGGVAISNLGTPIEAFVPRKTDESLLQPIWNATRAFSLPMIIHMFKMPKFFGLSILLYDGIYGKPPSTEEATNSTDNSSDTSTAGTTKAYHTTEPVTESNATVEEVIIIPPKFAVFFKFWTTFSVSSTTPYDYVCVIPNVDEMQDNDTCTTVNTGHPRMCTVSYDQALKAAPKDVDITADELNVFVSIRSIPVGFTLKDFEQTTKIASFEDSKFKPINYTLYGILADCKYYDTDEKKWKHDGTEVGPLTTVQTTHCLVRHLTSFSSGFSLPINDLHLEDSGFAHLAENPIAFVFCLCIIALYLILLVWCRRKDKEDKMKAGIAPLPDNDPEDKYLYQMVFYTGSKPSSGTTAKLYFIITGDKDETEVRCAEDLQRCAFQRNGIDTFIMAVPKPLGKMTHLRIWHDNGGKSPSWFFKRLQMLDVQTGEQFFFICEQWLAVEELDGQVERVVPVAGKNDLTAFDQLFMAKTQKNLFDGHIWFSVFRRPPRSHFTRVQRLTCCLSLIFCTMVANIMFFGTDSKQTPSAVILSVGPVTVTLTTLLMAVISGLVVVPVNAALVMIFRYAKPRPAKTPMKEYEEQMKYQQKLIKKEEKQIKKQIKKEEKLKKKDGKLSEQTVNHEDIPPAVEEKPKPHSNLPEEPKVIKIDTRAKKKFQLPHWFIYVGYILAFCTVAVAFWLIVQFAFGFGRAKAITWVIAMFISLIQSIIFVQPIKIICLAIVYALLCKKPEKDEDEPGEIELLEGDVYMHGMYSLNDLYDPAKRKEVKEMVKKSRRVVPPELQAIQAARERKMRELAMWALIKEIAFYAIFLYTIMMVAYGERDMLAFRAVQNNMNIFVSGRHILANNSDPPVFTDIKNYNDFFEWAQQVLLTGLYPPVKSDMTPTDATNMYSWDEKGYRVGTARIRQVRVKQDSCKVHPNMKNIIYHCRDAYGIFDEDKGDYKNKWIPLDPNVTDDKPDEYFKYNSMSALHSQPYIGLVASYWGGGYVADLGAIPDDASSVMQELFDSGWLDAQTRAIFVEFSLFYPSSNMFVISQLVVEFLSSGSTVTDPVFEVMKLNPYDGPNGIALIVAQVCVCLFLLFFLYREVKKLKKEKKKYFFEFWNWLEVIVIALSITAIVMFVYRMNLRKEATDFYQANPTVFNNMASALFWEQVYGYMIYIILFIANVKFLRILRFNRRVSAIVDVMHAGGRYMMAFLGTFGLVFMAFACTSYMMFGVEVLDFMNFVSTIEALCVIMLGHFDWNSFHDANRVLGPCFFICFIIVINFILLNMFLSIVNDAFAVVKHDNAYREAEFEMVNFIAFKLKSVFCGVSAVEPSVEGAFYHEAPDPFDQDVDMVNEKLDDMVDRLQELVKQEKAKAYLVSDLDLDADGVVKRRVFMSD